MIGATINLEWYNGDSLVKTNSCTVGGTIGTLPTTTPTKKGYTFNGWRVDRTCGIANLDVGTDGNGFYGYNLIEFNGSKCYGHPVDSSTNRYPCGETPDLAGPGEWKTEFPYGTIYGEASCNATSYNTEYPNPWSSNIYTLYEGNKKPGNTFSKYTSTPSRDEGYCWCRITGFTVNPNPGEAYDYSNGAQCNVASSAWVYRFDNDTGNGCAERCANGCASYVRGYSGFREAVFGAVGE